MGLGHELDASTLALWRFDDIVSPDATGAGFTNSDGVAMTYESRALMTAGANGIGITDYAPVAGQYARVFRSRDATGGMGTSLSSATSGTIQTQWKGSWTIETYVRIDTLPSNFCPILAHVGEGTSETAANNTIGCVGVLPTGKLRYFHESGAGTNTILDTATNHVVAGTWYYLAFVKDSAAKTVTFYVDNVAVETIGYASEATDGSSGLELIARDSNNQANGNRGNFSIRDLSMYFSVKDSTHLAQNLTNKTTTGLLVTTGASSDRRQWHFNQTPAALDVSGNGRHLFLASTGVTGLTSSILDDGGKARWLGSSWYYMNFDATVLAALLAEFTLECWLILEGTTTPNRGIYNHGDPAFESEDTNFIGCRITTGYAFDFGTENAGGTNTVFASGTGMIEPATLVHLAIRKRMSGGTYTMDVFTNGVLAYTSAGGHTNPTGSDDPETAFFKLLSSHTASTFRGSIDDCRLSDVARSDAEILASYERGGFVGASGEGYDQGFIDGVNSVVPSTVGGIGYFGAYFGGTGIEEGVVEDTGPEPIEAEVESPQLEYVDHLAVALSRLPQYAKAKATE